LGSVLLSMHTACPLDHDVVGGEGAAFFAFLYAAIAARLPASPSSFVRGPA